jgi:hypothetical protein
MLAFIPDYMERIIEIGEQDAERQAEQLATLLEPGAPATAALPAAEAPEGGGSR